LYFSGNLNIIIKNAKCKYQFEELPLFSRLAKASANDNVKFWILKGEENFVLFFPLVSKNESSVCNFAF